MACQAKGRKPAGGLTSLSGPVRLDIEKEGGSIDEYDNGRQGSLQPENAINTSRLNTPASDGWSRAFRNTESMRNPTTGEQIDVTGGYLQYYQDYSGRIYGSNDPTDFYLQTKIGGTVLAQTR